MCGHFTVTPIPTNPDEVLVWVGLSVGGILSFLPRLIQSRNLSGGLGWGGSSLVTKALLLRRSNTDCRARMNCEILAATFC